MALNDSHSLFLCSHVEWPKVACVSGENQSSPFQQQNLSQQDAVVVLNGSSINKTVQCIPHRYVHRQSLHFSLATHVQVLVYVQSCSLTIIIRSPKVSNHKILGGQHLSLRGKNNYYLVTIQCSHSKRKVRCPRLCSNGAWLPQATNIWSRVTEKEKWSPVRAPSFRLVWKPETKPANVLKRNGNKKKLPCAPELPLARKTKALKVHQ